MDTPSNSLPELLTTKEAAAALRRQPQTLRCWSFGKRGPIKPVNVYGRLVWRRDDVLALLEKGAA